MPLPALAGVALRHGLDGLAFAVAIPASLGGAVRMNAGAHGGEIADVVTRSSVLADRGRGAPTIGADEAGFAYRRSALPAGRAWWSGRRSGCTAGRPGHDPSARWTRLALAPRDPADRRAELRERLHEPAWRSRRPP